jgi:hypothetical protein
MISYSLHTGKRQEADLHWRFIYTELNESKLIQIQVHIPHEIMGSIGKDQLISLGRDGRCQER